jgi:UDP-N-acetylglucosamine 2-epimerase (non-hydrolysing)
MVVIFYGTSAELIKLLGIVKRIPRSQMLLICTAQHREGLKKLHPQLGVEPDIYLSYGWKDKDVANIKQMLGMMLKAHGRFFAQYRAIKKRIKESDKKHNTKSIAMVHGDTLTTVVGAYMGRLLGLPVCHVEAGLRTWNWRSPFPEELDRRIVARIARIHFAPNETAITNLKREKIQGEIIDTKFNTAKDAIEMSDQFVSEEFKRLKLPKKYCLVLLHRTELLENRHDFEAILKTLNEYASKERPIVFTMHTTTNEKLRAYGFEHYLKKPGIHIIPKQPYFDYMTIVRGADCIVADGGGIQEDAFFFGIPIMIHRNHTEREEGLGFNADISRMDVNKVRDFLYYHKDKKEFSRLRHDVSPSQIVVDYLLKRKFISSQLIV